jgi:hypothetical protein
MVFGALYTPIRPLGRRVSTERESRMDQPPRVPFTFMFVAAFFVILGIGVLNARQVLHGRWDDLTMK